MHATNGTQKGSGGAVGAVRSVQLTFILCAVYLLLGMALIAMCFNLMQVIFVRFMSTQPTFKLSFK